jgi:DNA primase
MGKIAPVSAKYIIHTKIEADGVVEKPDVIGAVFGQTEGLLGSDLELRELQKSGRIGRIDAELQTKDGKTTGTIMIPSSLNKTETALIAAAMETIQRIGPCESRLEIQKIEDVRLSKRDFLMDRAKELLKTMIDSEIPDSHEITDEVKSSVKERGMIKFGPEQLAAGPDVPTAEEIIVVEGRADVVNLIHSDVKNAISMDGTNVPDTIAKLCNEREVTAFVDGDRGGDLIIKELLQRTKIDFVAFAPSGKEVEELAQKEILKALRSRTPIDEYLEKNKSSRKSDNRRSDSRRDSDSRDERPGSRDRRSDSRGRRSDSRRDSDSRGRGRDSNPRDGRSDSRDRRSRDRSDGPRSSSSSRTGGNNPKFKKFFEELKGTKGAYILNKDMDVLGKVPVGELSKTLQDLEGVFTVIMDGVATKDVIVEAEKVKLSFLVASDKELDSRTVTIITKRDM